MLFKRPTTSDKQYFVPFISRREMPAIPQPTPSTSQRRDTRPKTVTDPILLKIHQLIERSPREELQIDDLPKMIGVSRAQIYRIIKNKTGQSPSRFVCSIRLDKAMILLQTTSRSITDIAMSVGFNDPKYFCRVFRREFNKTPSAVR
jgi:transcriptional regulator GlxA family with amidase domain